MTTFEKYKKLYSTGDDDIVVCEKGRKINIPHWLKLYILHTTGLKSRKHRHIKKRVKNEIQNAIMRAYGQSRQ